MKLVETAQICSGFVPVDLQDGANNGDYISMELYNHVAVVFYKAAGTAGDDPTLTLQQATSAAGADAKDLDFTEIWIKQGADLEAIGQFTKTTQAASHTYTDTDSAEEQAIWVVEFDASDLDTDNEFAFLRATVADVGTNAQNGALLYVLTEPRYTGSAPPSALA